MTHSSCLLDLIKIRESAEFTTQILITDQTPACCTAAVLMSHFQYFDFRFLMPFMSLLYLLMCLLVRSKHSFRDTKQILITRVKALFVAPQLHCFRIPITRFDIHWTSEWVTGMRGKVQLEWLVLCLSYACQSFHIRMTKMSDSDQRKVFSSWSSPPKFDISLT